MEQLSESLQRQRFLDVEPVEPERTATNRRSSVPSRLLSDRTKAVMSMLMGLAEVRQAAVNETTLLMYKPRACSF